MKMIKNIFWKVITSGIFWIGLELSLSYLMMYLICRMSHMAVVPSLKVSLFVCLIGTGFAALDCLVTSDERKHD